MTPEQKERIRQLKEEHDRDTQLIALAKFDERMRICELLDNCGTVEEYRATIKRIKENT